MQERIQRRVKCRRCGDICAMVRDYLDSGDKHVESVYVEMRNSEGKKSPVGAVYKPTNSNHNMKTSV